MIVLTVIFIVLGLAMLVLGGAFLYSSGDLHGYIQHMKMSEKHERAIKDILGMNEGIIQTQDRLIALYREKIELLEKKLAGGSK